MVCSLSACDELEAPPCPLPGAGITAPSAGCFAIRDNALLVVEGRNGTLSPPGGSAETGESARCTAFRETWEETGLRLHPEQEMNEFDTGFKLFYCAHHADSGEIDPPPRLEVRRAFYLPLQEFDQWTWRYPGQQTVLAEHLRALTNPADHAKPEPPPTTPETR